VGGLSDGLRGNWGFFLGMSGGGGIKRTLGEGRYEGENGYSAVGVPVACGRGKRTLLVGVGTSGWKILGGFLDGFFGVGWKVLEGLFLFRIDRGGWG